MPFSDVNLRTKTPKAPKWSSDSSLSEVSSMQLEFRDLAYETTNHVYEVYLHLFQFNLIIKFIGILFVFLGKILCNIKAFARFN